MAKPKKTDETQETTRFDDLQADLLALDNVVAVQKFIADLREVEGLALTRLSSLITQEGAPE